MSNFLQRNCTHCKLYRLHPVQCMSFVIAVKRTNKATISPMKAKTDIHIYIPALFAVLTATTLDVYIL
jgi:hypothetical protein